VASTWNVLNYRLWGVAALVVLASWSWWVAALVLASTVAVNVTWSAYSQQIFEDIFRDRRRRRARWYRSLLIEQDNAKEVRLFGLTSFGLERFSATWQRAMTDLWRGRRRSRVRSCSRTSRSSRRTPWPSPRWPRRLDRGHRHRHPAGVRPALTQRRGWGCSVGDMQTMVIRQQTLLLDLEDLAERLPEPPATSIPHPPDRNGQRGGVPRRALHLPRAHRADVRRVDPGDRARQQRGGRRRERRRQVDPDQAPVRVAPPGLGQGARGRW
jgi:hypothetical protein